jgi:hypothetical protein
MGGPPASSESGGPDEPEAWQLRAATLDHVDGLHALAAHPLVYRHLFDGAAPERETVAQLIAQAMDCAAAGTGLGLWMLEGRRTARRLRPRHMHHATEHSFRGRG